MHVVFALRHWWAWRSGKDVIGPSCRAAAGAKGVTVGGGFDNPSNTLSIHEILHRVAWTDLTLTDGQSVIGLQGVDQFVRKPTLPTDGLAIGQLMASVLPFQLPQNCAHPFLDVADAVPLFNFVCCTIRLLLQEHVVGLAVPVRDEVLIPHPVLQASLKKFKCATRLHATGASLKVGRILMVLLPVDILLTGCVLVLPLPITRVF